jgi:hypothetical protein
MNSAIGQPQTDPILPRQDLAGACSPRARWQVRPQCLSSAVAGKVALLMAWRPVRTHQGCGVRARHTWPQAGGPGRQNPFPTLRNVRPKTAGRPAKLCRGRVGRRARLPPGRADLYPVVAPGGFAKSDQLGSLRGVGSPRREPSPNRRPCSSQTAAFNHEPSTNPSAPQTVGLRPRGHPSKRSIARNQTQKKRCCRERGLFNVTQQSINLLGGAGCKRT